VGRSIDEEAASAKRKSRILGILLRLFVYAKFTALTHASFSCQSKVSRIIARQIFQLILEEPIRVSQIQRSSIIPDHAITFS